MSGKGCLCSAEDILTVVLCFGRLIEFGFCVVLFVYLLVGFFVVLFSFGLLVFLFVLLVFFCLFFL